MARRVRLLHAGGARRARWGVVDQGVSSLTNFGVMAVAARYSDPERFGAFGFAFAVYVLCLWITRSLVNEPFVIRLTEADREVREAEAARALGTSCVLGVVAGAVMAGLAGISAPSGRAVLLAMGVGMPALLLQDGYRYVLIAAGRTGAAAVNDGLWLVLQAALITVLVATDRTSAAWVCLSFGAAAVVACAMARVQAGLTPALGAAPDWLRRHRDLGLPFLYELVVVNGMTQVAILAIGLLGRVVTVGELRAATLLFGPPTVLCAGVYLAALPEAVRLAAVPRSVRRLVVAMGVALSAATVLWGVAVALAPDSAGVALLGDNWPAGRRLLLPVAGLGVATAWMLAVAVGVRALGAARRTLRRRSLAAPVILLLAVTGTAAGGSTGAAAGLAAGSGLSAVLAWSAFQRVLAEAAPAPGRG